MDREKAALYDLSTSEVGTAIRVAIQGMEAAKYRTGNEEYDIVVRLAEPYRDELGALRDLNIMSDGRLIPLLSVADWDVEEGYGSIRRKDLDRMATISSDVASGLNASATLAEVRETLAPFESSLAPGYTIRYTGEEPGLGRSAGLPHLRLRAGADAHRLHPRVTVQLRRETGHDPDLGGHVHGGRPPRARPLQHGPSS